MSKNEKLVWGFRGAMAVCVLSVFLPWISVSMFGVSASEAGIKNWRGILALLFALAGGGLSFLSLPALKGKEKIATAAAAGAVAFFALIYWFEAGSYGSFGMYLALLAGIGGAVAGFMADWAIVDRKNLNVNVSVSDPDDAGDDLGDDDAEKK